MIDRIKTTVRNNKIIVFSYLAAIAMYIMAMLIVPGFGVGAHFGILIRETAVLGIMAFGQAFVILTGGIDISTPWTMTSAGILLTFLSKGSTENLYWIIPFILLVGTVIGFINGIGVAYLKIPPIIMTMGMNQIIQGALLALLKGQPGGNAPESMYKLMTGNILGVPTLLIVWIVLIVIAFIIQSRTVFGRRLYAVGNGPAAAYFAGVNVKLTTMMVYVISGLVTSFAGICFAARLGQSYLGMGDPYQFMTVVCVVLGGASMMGGRGKYIGTVAGTFILQILTVFLAALGLPTSLQEVLYGVILVVAVILIPTGNPKSS